MAADAIFKINNSQSASARVTRSNQDPISTYSGTVKRDVVSKSASIDSNGVIPTNYSRFRASTRNTNLNYFRRNYHYPDTRKTLITSTIQYGLPRYLWSYTRHVQPTANNILWTQPEWAEVDNTLLEYVNNGSLELGTTLAESYETSKYVALRGLQVAKFASLVATGNPIGALRSVGWTRSNARNLLRKKGIKRRSKSLADFASSTWLEINFALRPTVSDINKVTSLYMDPSSVLRRISCSARKVLPVQDDWKFTTWNGYTINHNTHLRLCSKVHFGINDPDAVARKALGLNSLSHSLYQVVPFSWALDYVVNLGDWLKLRSATDGLYYKHGYRSMRIQQSSTESYSKLTTTEGNTFTNTSLVDSSGVASVDAYARQRTYGFPIPRIENIWDPTTRQVTNLTAVAYQLVRNINL